LRKGDFIINVFEDKPTKWPVAKKQIKIYTHATNSYDFARRLGHYRYIINLSMK
jgi:hypothetical protein